MPLKHFLDLFRHSPILTAYIYGCCVCLFPELVDADSPLAHRLQSARPQFCFDRLADIAIGDEKIFRICVSKVTGENSYLGAQCDH